jgi:hypothetical protein
VNFVLYPLFSILQRSFVTPEGIGLGNYVRYFTNPRLVGIIGNTFAVTLTATAVTIVLAYGFAYAMHRSMMPGKAVLRLIVLTPLFAPSLVQALGLQFLLGRNGFVNRTFGLDIDIYGFSGIVIADILMWLIGAQVHQLDPPSWLHGPVRGIPIINAYASYRLALIPIGILIGGVIAHFYSRRHPPGQHDRVLHRGVLFSSGVIAGEALTAVALAGLAAIEIMGVELPITDRGRLAASLVATAAAVVVFISMCRPQDTIYPGQV